MEKFRLLSLSRLPNKSAHSVFVGNSDVNAVDEFFLRTATHTRFTVRIGAPVVTCVVQKYHLTQ